MTHPQMPNIPGANVMHDTLDFVKNLWGSMNVPGLAVPTLSVEELDKKINDLKAVEAWLGVNMNMLRGSIQALEVQRGTIATLKSVGASLASAAQQPASSDKSIFDANPYVSAFFHHARNADKDKPAPAEAPKPAAPTAPPAPEASSAASAANSKPAASADAAPMANPAAWWNMLQEQFKQAVASTVPPASAKPAAKAAAPAKAKAKPTAGSSARKPAAKRAPAKPKAAGSKA